MKQLKKGDKVWTINEDFTGHYPVQQTIHQDVWAGDKEVRLSCFTHDNPEHYTSFERSEVFTDERLALLACLNINKTSLAALTRGTDEIVARLLNMPCMPESWKYCPECEKAVYDR